MLTITIAQPYLLFVGDVDDPLTAKTATGVRDWQRALCLGQYRLAPHAVDLGLPDLTFKQAVDRGVKSMLIGVALRGQVFPEVWIDAVVEAMEAGLDVASGLHLALSDIPRLREASARTGKQLIDVRRPPAIVAVGSGKKRSGKRLLAVGTDCSVGKMYTTLSIHREMQRRGLDASFRATGQTGIFIEGSGICVDAVIADFISGAVELLSPEQSPAHWDIIEGQGSLFHPSYAGVSLGLLHGAQPDALVLCHDAVRPHMRLLPDFPIPELEACAEANLRAARLTNPAVRLVGLSINTSKLPKAERTSYLESIAKRFGLPAVDPILDGAGALVDALLTAPHTS